MEEVIFKVKFIRGLGGIVGINFFKDLCVWCCGYRRGFLSINDGGIGSFF